MTTITPFAAGSYLTTRNASQLQALKGQLNDLTNQLSSGQVSQTYGGLGSGRSTALSAQATLSALTGYAGHCAARTSTLLRPRARPADLHHAQQHQHGQRARRNADKAPQVPALACLSLA